MTSPGRLSLDIGRLEVRGQIYSAARTTRPAQQKHTVSARACRVRLALPHTTRRAPNCNDERSERRSRLGSLVQRFPWTWQRPWVTPGCKVHSRPSPRHGMAEPEHTYTQEAQRRTKQNEEVRKEKKTAARLTQADLPPGTKPSAPPTTRAPSSGPVPLTPPSRHVIPLHPLPRHATRRSPQRAGFPPPPPQSPAATAG